MYYKKKQQQTDGSEEDDYEEDVEQQQSTPPAPASTPPAPASTTSASAGVGIQNIDNYHTIRGFAPVSIGAEDIQISNNPNVGKDGYLISKDDTTPQACAAECNRLDYCTGFTWDSKNDRCVLLKLNGSMDISNNHARQNETHITSLKTGPESYKAYHDINALPRSLFNDGSPATNGLFNITRVNASSISKEGCQRMCTSSASTCHGSHYHETVSGGTNSKTIHCYKLAMNPNSSGLNTYIKK